MTQDLSQRLEDATEGGAVAKLIAKLETRDPTDRLMVMAQNPANNHHWSLGLGMVSAAELLAYLTFARDAIAALRSRAKAKASPDTGEGG